MLYDPERQTTGLRQTRSIICWTRMQAEAGQGLEMILARKDLERRTCDGTFLWGVGNAPGSEPARLARGNVPVDVIFSVMKSRPKERDANASELNVWRGYTDQFGVERALPAGALVTSRAAEASSRVRSHYALMCRSDLPVTLRDLGPFNPKAFRNVGGRGAPVGASQVTALLREFEPNEEDQGGYRANVRATLTGGYWVRLINPVRLGPARARSLLSHLDDVTDMCPENWLELVTDLRRGPRQPAGPSTLFEHADGMFARGAPVV
ncbi:hypothetical protein QH494_10030 [Sphingomonas sp. AR_OL41]|uniref:hypothetical protein n=1 Tax=Sphingomonas sp. AR_OL41 TaxID=3042729 RepID=UPI002480F0E6|nr:hypothetical protein [Sphingomonas sp. AR_OL41]MDH7972520.1 hypothetical protein [Sphingomonas sp. AR_OL41]